MVTIACICIDIQWVSLIPRRSLQAEAVIGLGTTGWRSSGSGQSFNRMQYYMCLPQHVPGLPRVAGRGSGRG